MKRLERGKLIPEVGACVSNRNVSTLTFIVGGVFRVFFFLIWDIFCTPLCELELHSWLILYHFDIRRVWTSHGSYFAGRAKILITSSNKLPRCAKEVQLSIQPNLVKNNNILIRIVTWHRRKTLWRRQGFWLANCGFGVISKKVVSFVYTALV